MINDFSKSNFFVTILLIVFVAALFFCDGLHKSYHGSHHQENHNQKQDSHLSMIVAIQPKTSELTRQLNVDNYSTSQEHFKSLVQVGFFVLSVVFLLWQILGKLYNYLSWWRSRGLLNPEIFPRLSLV